MNKATAFHRSIFWLYILSIAAAPFYFGGERLLSWVVIGIFQSAVCISIALHEHAFPIKKIQKDLQYRLMIWLFSVVLLWAIIQFIPLPNDIIANPIWQLSDAILGNRGYHSLSITPDESVLTFFKIFIVFITFLNGVHLLYNRIQEQLFLDSLVVIGTGYAIFGLYWHYSYPGTQVWIGQAPYQYIAVSTFVNRNTFAMYLAIHIQITLALLLYNDTRGFRKNHMRTLIAYNLKQNLSRKLTILSAYSVQLAVLVLTTSRAGVTFALAGQVFMILMFSISHIRQAFSLIIIVPILLALAIYIISQNSLSIDIRSMEIEDNLNGRLELYQEVWATILKEPIFGFGLGSFEHAFRMHKAIDFDPGGIWLRAHNLFLESTISLGIPATSLLIFAWIHLCVMIMRNSIRQGTSLIGIVALSSTVALSLHSLFDFGLQSGANAITYSALAGCALGRIKTGRRSEA